jgi:hypothetical protein
VKPPEDSHKKLFMNNVRDEFPRTYASLGPTKVTIGER